MAGAPLRAPARVLGVLGGMGPAATLDFHAKLLAADAGALLDQDHLRVIIDSNPLVPDRNLAVAGLGPSPGPVLADMARGLERAGAQGLVMTCNAAHAFRAEVEAAVSIPLIDIVEATARATARRVPGLERAGVLASSGCLDARLYPDAFAPLGVEVVELRAAWRDRFTALLYRIKAGDVGAGARLEMREIAGALADAGAQAVVAGCTEAPLVLDDGELDVPMIDSTAALVAAALAFARGGAPRE